MVSAWSSHSQDVKIADRTKIQRLHPSPLHSDLGWAIAISQYLPFRFATVFCRQGDCFVVQLVW